MQDFTVFKKLISTKIYFCNVYIHLNVQRVDIIPIYIQKLEVYILAKSCQL
jgi:hypothetical protein